MKKFIELVAFNCGALLTVIVILGLIFGGAIAIMTTIGVTSVFRIFIGFLLSVIWFAFVITILIKLANFLDKRTKRFGGK